MTEISITIYIHAGIQETGKTTNPALKDSSYFINFDFITED